MAETTIEWTRSTWNPVLGCSRVSDGCTNCYAEKMSARQFHLKTPGYAGLTNGNVARPQWTGQVVLMPDRLEAQHRRKKGKLTFVNSMSDLLHAALPFDDLLKVVECIKATPQHVYQVLTKRPERLEELREKGLRWPDNVWLGVSVESEQYMERIDLLRDEQVTVRFLSLEPLLGPLPNLDLDGIHWVIVGGESGRRARPMDPEWVREIREQCIAADVPFFFKQWGGKRKKKSGRELDGRFWDEMPRGVYIPQK